MVVPDFVPCDFLPGFLPGFSSDGVASSSPASARACSSTSTRAAYISGASSWAYCRVRCSPSTYAGVVPTNAGQ